MNAALMTSNRFGIHPVGSQFSSELEELNSVLVQALESDDEVDSEGGYNFSDEEATVWDEEEGNTGEYMMFSECWLLEVEATYSQIPTLQLQVLRRCFPVLPQRRIPTSRTKVLASLLPVRSNANHENNLCR